MKLTWEVLLFYLCNYRPQTKFAKVMFLQVSVCPQWGGVRGCGGGRVWLGGCAWLLGACMVVGGVPGCRGGVHGCRGGTCMVVGGHVWLQGACMVAGGMHGCGGVCMVGGMHGCGGCAWWGGCGIRWDTVNERAVRILLECILVFTSFQQQIHGHWFFFHSDW